MSFQVEINYLAFGDYGNQVPGQVAYQMDFDCVVVPDPATLAYLQLRLWE